MARDGIVSQVQEIPEEETVLRQRVHGILLESNGGNERMTPSGASETLYNAGLGLRYVQVSGVWWSFVLHKTPKKPFEYPGIVALFTFVSRLIYPCVLLKTMYKMNFPVPRSHPFVSTAPLPTGAGDHVRGHRFRRRDRDGERGGRRGRGGDVRPEAAREPAAPERGRRQRERVPGLEAGGGLGYRRGDDRRRVQGKSNSGSGLKEGSGEGGWWGQGGGTRRLGFYQRPFCSILPRFRRNRLFVCARCGSLVCVCLCCSSYFACGLKEGCPRKTKVVQQPY